MTFSGHAGGWIEEWRRRTARTRDQLGIKLSRLRINRTDLLDNRVFFSSALCGKETPKTRPCDCMYVPKKWTDGRWRRDTLSLPSSSSATLVVIELLWPILAGKCGTADFYVLADRTHKALPARSSFVLWSFAVHTHTHTGKGVQCVSWYCAMCFSARVCVRYVVKLQPHASEWKHMRFYVVTQHVSLFGFVRDVNN